jgi:choline dehydrogenase
VQDAAKEFGIMPREDFNDGDNEGSGFFEVNQNKGVRWNSAKAFLRPALRRPNLRLVINAHVEKVLFDGKRATSVRYRVGSETVEAKAGGEVLLTAGSINTPKLLELSGVGQPDRLAGLGVDVVHASADVGENLQDHLQIRTVYKVSSALTLNTLANSLTGKARIALQYAFARSGPMSMAPSQFGMFSKSDPSMATPDLEYHVQPLSTDRLGDPLHPFPAITMSVCNLRPDSVGSVHATTRDLAVQPEIRLNYLSTVRDREIALRSVRQARSIMTAKALEAFHPEEILPGLAHQSDDDLLHQIGSIATTIFHPVGTCRMGIDDRAVVSPDLRVTGVEGLRVIDASIMPRIVSGNTASPVVMIAEKAADMIRRPA